MTAPSQFITYDRSLKWMDLSPLLRDVGGAPLTTVELAYRTVPWLHRAVLLRAQTVSAVQWRLLNEDNEEIDAPDVMARVREWMGVTLYLAELSRCLYGSAYFVLERNRVGRNLTPKHIPSPYVAPEWSADRSEIAGWRVSSTQRSSRVAPDAMLYTWLPNPFSPTEPGPAPASVALQAAGLLAALDEMATRYFRSGAVPITAVLVPPTVPREERERVETWFQRAAAGIRNFAKFLTINKDTEFKTLGNNLKDALAVELVEQQRDNVAAALGVPPSVIDGTAANYATAQSDMVGFYVHTIIPECRAIADDFTRRLFAQFGLRFEFDYNSIDAMQSIQLQQAQALSALTGGVPLLTVDEARAWLGMEPPAQRAVAQPMEPDTEQMKRWRAQALEQVRAGKRAQVGAPFDDELAGASTPGMVRAVFERHWQRRGSDSWLSSAVRELARYNDLAENQIG